MIFLLLHGISRQTGRDGQSGVGLSKNYDMQLCDRAAGEE